MPSLRERPREQHSARGRNLRQPDGQPNAQADRTASQGQLAQHEDAVVSTHGVAGTTRAAVHEDTLVNGRIARAQPCAIYEGALVNRHSACGRSLRQADRQPNAQADSTASQGQLAQHEAAVVNTHGVAGTIRAAVHENAPLNGRNACAQPCTAYEDALVNSTQRANAI